MTQIANTMAGSTIMPKWFDVGVHAIVCTQAIASGAASDQDYKLFPIASGMTIVDCVARLSAGINATNTYFYIGLASGGDDLVGTSTLSLVTPQRGGTGCTLPYTCTADSYAYLVQGAAATAAANMVVTCFVTNTETMD